jgi:hypothetical protein
MTNEELFEVIAAKLLNDEAISRKFLNRQLVRLCNKWLWLFKSDQLTTVLRLNTDLKEFA